ncbi:histidine kinase-like protein [Streptomyces sp. SLBN-118]|uniref:ATP-binding protein n=1 Tax=Streptomyces sp. SLBN-118 TaxID=2768454 RepID=UPI00114DB192|nr:ATP-binding protein [Streptomyces sp. SLBN-118]TQK50887.1 histidine kinase-like protein [Streptomyces sp. SLBN-118]
MEPSKSLSPPDRKPTYTTVDDGTADGPRNTDHTSCRLAHRPEAVGRARRIVGAMLGNWQVGEDAATSVLLVVSELVTNAVEHACPPLAVHLHLHREHAGLRVWVGVTDGGPAERHGNWAATCAADERGRGLCIIDALATSHGSRTHWGGTTHWARLSVRQHAPIPGLSP